MNQTETIQTKPTREAAKPRSAKKQRGKVVIYGRWCKGCGLCAAFCPSDVLAFDDSGHPYVQHPDRCTACHWCDTHCPDFAIVVRRIRE
ncbi:MAG: 4Fe-4S binding protein [Anaerolineales bacterium]|nr:4Fe-4S binding protein [Anaerolineales bacterium]